MLLLAEVRLCKKLRNTKAPEIIMIILLGERFIALCKKRHLLANTTNFFGNTHCSVVMVVVNLLFY